MFSLKMVNDNNFTIYVSRINVDNKKFSWVSIPPTLLARLRPAQRMSAACIW